MNLDTIAWYENILKSSISLITTKFVFKIRVKCRNRPCGLKKLHVSSLVFHKCRRPPCGQTIGSFWSLSLTLVSLSSLVDISWRVIWSFLLWTHCDYQASNIIVRNSVSFSPISKTHQNLIFSTHQTQGRFLAMVICFCANEAVIRTSWTNTNPGRRFWSCAQSVSLLNCFLFHL